MNEIISKKGTPDTRVTIPAPRISTAVFEIVGTAPLVIHKFSRKGQTQMEEAQRAGCQTQSKKKRPPKDFEALAEAAKYKSADGWCGFNAAAMRNALIGACRLVNFKMTIAKLSIWVVADGRDAEDGTPLVRIYGKAPRVDIRPARNDNGSVDLRARPMWPDWSAKVKLQWDEDQFSLGDVANLLARVGMQCGIGEGRPSSKMSAGIGWGTFEVKS
jgi:hypothetical protein